MGQVVRDGDARFHVRSHAAWAGPQSVSVGRAAAMHELVVGRYGDELGNEGRVALGDVTDSFAGRAPHRIAHPRQLALLHEDLRRCADDETVRGREITFPDDMGHGCSLPLLEMESARLSRKSTAVGLKNLFGKCPTVKSAPAALSYPLAFQPRQQLRQRECAALPRHFATVLEQQQCRNRADVQLT